MKNNYGILSKKNRIFALAKESKRIPNVVLAVLIVILIFIGAEIIASIPVRFLDKIILRNSLETKALAFSINHLILPFGFLILGFFARVKYREKRKISTMGFEKENVLKKYVRGFFIGLLMIGLCVFIFSVLGMVTIDSSNSSEKGWSAIVGILILLVGWVVQGASEEVIVRGWMLPIIGVRHNVLLGIFVSSIFFGVLHLFNDHIDLVPMINLILFGIFAALYAIWEGGLWGICALHSSWNFAQGNLFGFEVSGHLPVGGILIDFNPVIGSELLTGGKFGIEGGIVCSAVLLLGIGVLIIKGGNKAVTVDIQKK